MAALNEEPSFALRVNRDLDALEQRLKQYDVAMRSAQDRAVRELQDALGKETDPMQLMVAYTKCSMLLGGLAGTVGAGARCRFSRAR